MAAEESTTPDPSDARLCKQCGQHPAMQGRRICTKCRYQQSVEHGKKDPTKRQAQKKHKNALARQRRRKNPEKINAPARKRHAANPEKRRGQCRASYAKHRTQRLLDKKTHREEHLDEYSTRAHDKYYKDLEKSQAYNRNYAWDHREHLRPLAQAAAQQRKAQDPLGQYLLKQGRDQRRKARQYGLPCLWNEIYVAYALQWWDYQCAYCGDLVTEGFWHRLHWDHFIALSDPACPGTVPWNLLPTCGASPRAGSGRDVPLCNGSKGKLTPEQWLLRMMVRKRQALLRRELTLAERRACESLVTKKLKKIALFFAEIQAFAVERGDMLPEPDLSVLSV